MQKIKQWLAQSPFKDYSIEVASEDASFRRYFRLRLGKESLIMMDASLEKESLKPFVDVTERLLSVGVHAPRILASDLDAGFLILDDLGSVQLLDILKESNYLSYYSLALEEILKMQQAEISGLPVYDRDFLKFEMALMQKWFLEQYVDVSLSVDDKEMLAETLEGIATEVLRQPQGYFVHRDFHSRNLMFSCSEEIVVIDYQDARVGSLTYDLVSLLRDVYVEVDSETVEMLALRFRDKIGLDVEDETFMKWFDFTGLQRHIKILGIFARLAIRDGKKNYLNDIPLTLKYILEVGAKYPETQDLVKLLKKISV